MYHNFLTFDFFLRSTTLMIALDESHHFNNKTNKTTITIKAVVTDSLTY